MEKDRGSRIIAIVALCVAILGLSIGFAAFTRDLNITYTDSNVKINGDLDIKFLASEDINDKSTVVNGQLGLEGLHLATSANPITISSDGRRISGVGATFSSNDQVVVYNFYVYNNSEYDAYLKSVEFLNYAGYNSNKVCTALEGTTQSLVDDACKDIHFLIEFADDGILDVGTTDFTSPLIKSGEVLPIYVGIIYAGDAINKELLFGDDSALLPNGDFKINFGDIKFSYSTLEG